MLEVIILKVRSRRKEDTKLAFPEWCNYGVDPADNDHDLARKLEENKGKRKSEDEVNLA